ncbi:galactosamine-6-phosphate isomerase [Pontibacter sp. E15-1]|uniref:galactosamine-6-phosphate isomerase n=1 Tax=Pontibacter sp. E15-1 TaxID=2919918 RepID=UPI001F4F89F5|nr:galactosamine-6-phosphate isomerase [Pontibacter sp. E15-1]MCJ8165655.1 galactosamine-6-phosphate isomerase [Pontibacter sp. E15-1]
MNIQYFKDYEAMSLQAAQTVYASIQARPNLLLCAATGNSPTGLYRQLQQYHIKRAEDFKSLRVIKLDEWGGLYAEHPATCEYYLQKHIVQPLGIDNGRYFGFDANTQHPEEECKRVQAALAAQSPIDICILGMGVNAHLGLNEPAEHLVAHCHIATLAPSTLDHTMVAGLETKPSYGLTLGIQDILSAKHIILLVSGPGKQKATQELLSGKITNDYPATHLWAHQHVDCMIVG